MLLSSFHLSGFESLPKAKTVVLIPPSLPLSNPPFRHLATNPLFFLPKMWYSSSAFPFLLRLVTPDSANRSKSNIPNLSKSPITTTIQMLLVKKSGWAFVFQDEAIRRDWKGSIGYGRHKKGSWLYGVRNLSCCLQTPSSLQVICALIKYAEMIAVFVSKFKDSIGEVYSFPFIVFASLYWFLALLYRQ